MCEGARLQSCRRCLGIGTGFSPGRMFLATIMRKSVQRNQKLNSKEQLEQVLLNSLNSGDPIEINPAMVDEIRNRLRSRAALRKLLIQ